MPRPIASALRQWALAVLACQSSCLRAALGLGIDGWRQRCKPALMAGMPPHYIAHKVRDSDISIDGRLSEPAWLAVPAVREFGSIYGPAFEREHPEEAPWHGTAAKVLWSEDHVYVGAVLRESQLWATDSGWTLPTQQVPRDRPRFDCSEAWIPSCPYRSADFEFFFSPGLHGNTEWYKEFEFNANVENRLGPAVMSLALPRPYRDLHGLIPLWLNPAVCTELKDCDYRVTTEGKINDPAWAAKHPNQSWTVEVKIPTRYLLANATGAERPAEGAQWRLAFSRVEYRLRPNASAPGGYEKLLATALERKQGHLDQNWVWPPTFMYDMHMPDLWAVLQFSELPPGSGPARFWDEQVNWPAYGTLSRLYYAQWDRQFLTGNFSVELGVLRRAYEVLANPGAKDAFKEERQILSFPHVPGMAWEPECANIQLEHDAETGWRASVSTPEFPREVWTVDGWRRFRVDRTPEDAALYVA